MERIFFNGSLDLLNAGGSRHRRSQVQCTIAINKAQFLSIKHYFSV